MPAHSSSNDSVSDKPANKLVIVMGVSGCGKSSVARAVAERLGCQFVEADDFHSAENKSHMASGKALTDAMREPWIADLTHHLARLADGPQDCVLSFSGLRAEHRQKMRTLPFETLFIHLAGAKKIIARRISSRNNHFMPSSLLDSQYAALESVDDERDVLQVDIDQPLESVIHASLALIVKNTGE